MSTNMTVEDRLAEKLKSAEFAQWFGEDDLRELVEKALNKAFLQPSHVTENYRSVERPARVVAFAEEHVRAKLDAIVLKAVSDKLAEAPEVIDQIVEKALAEGLETIVLRAVSKAIVGALGISEMNMQMRLVEMLRSGTIR